MSAVVQPSTHDRKGFEQSAGMANRTTLPSNVQHIVRTSLLLPSSMENPHLVTHGLHTLLQVLYE